MVLVDTSAWIQVFRRGEPLDLETVVPLDEIVTCLPVIQEVLQGMVMEAHFRLAREAMFNLPIVESPMTASLYEEAVGLYRSARRQGLTIRSSVDCLIAACALRHDLEVLHRDRDFVALAKTTALKQRSLR